MYSLARRVETGENRIMVGRCRRLEIKCLKEVSFDVVFVSVTDFYISILQTHPCV
jgi:hypothetical protein